MKFNNIRINHATNSSSTHSVLITKETYRDKDSIGELEFGWNEFVASSYEAKQNYIFAQLWDNLFFIPPKLRRHYIKELTGFDIIPDEDSDLSVNVDHQSKWAIPIKREMWYNSYKEIHEEFVKDLTDFIMKQNIIVIGGNDNEEYDFADSFEGTEALPDFFGTYSEVSNDCIQAYKDGDWWVFYNSRTGFKSTFSFKENPPPREKSLYPELLDISLTEICKYNCWYCYKSSKITGKHADTKLTLEFINYRLAKMEGLFEIAYGGGDPTEHPDFLTILKETKKNQITPNFSTKNVAWCIKHWDELKDVVGTIGISVDNYDIIIKKAEISYLSHLGAKIALHIIPELIPNKSFSGFIEEVIALAGYGISIICLGVKNTGNMVSLPSYRKDNINGEYKKQLAKAIKVNKHKTWSFDTCMVQCMKEYLDELGINETSYYDREGAYSCYIDAVNWTMSKSSYDEETVDCSKFYTEDILNQFKLY